MLCVVTPNVAEIRGGSSPFLLTPPYLVSLTQKEEKKCAAAPLLSSKKPVKVLPPPSQELVQEIVLTRQPAEIHFRLLQQSLSPLCNNKFAPQWTKTFRAKQAGSLEQLFPPPPPSSSRLDSGASNASNHICSTAALSGGWKRQRTIGRTLWHSSPLLSFLFGSATAHKHRDMCAYLT